MKITKRAFSIICAFMFLCLPTFQAFAYDSIKVNTNEYNDISILDLDEYYYIAGVDGGFEANSDSASIIDNYEIGIEELIANSVNITSSGSSIVGTYKSNKHDAGVTGYKYSISFDWTAKISGENYVFDTIKDYKVTTHANYILLALIFESHNYKVVKSTYSFGGNRSYISCITDYDFTVQDRTDHAFSTIHTNNHLTVTCEDCI